MDIKITKAKRKFDFKERYKVKEMKNILLFIAIWIAPLVLAKWAGVNLDFVAGFWFGVWTVAYFWWIFGYIPKREKEMEDERKKDKLKGW